MSRSRALVVFRKEVRDNLRDRRTLVAALVYPVLGPALLVLMLVVAVRTATEQGERPLELAIAGGDRAPTLVEFLEQQEVVLSDAPEDPESAVRRGDLEVALRITEEFGAQLASGTPAAVQLIVDDSRESARVTVGRTRALLSAYSRQIGSLRLVARGIDPAVVEALAIERHDVSTEQSQAARFLSMAPYFIVFSIFVGGMYLAIDTTAGERERGSLEPLLLVPGGRWELLLGKGLATLLFTLVAVLETLAGFAAVLELFPLEDLLGIRLSLQASTLAAIFLVTLPMTLIAVSLQMLIATFSRSFKEAQNYLSLLPLVPALPGLLLIFAPVKPKLWMMLIPTYGQQILINRLMRGELVSGPHLLVSALGTVLVAALLALLAVRLWRDERVVFRR